MAAPTDRVHILKTESASTGGTEEDEGHPSQLNPGQDAPSVHGLFCQPAGGPEDELCYITRDASGNWIFKDQNTPSEKTLGELGGLLPLDDLVFTGDLCIVVAGSDFVSTA